MSSSSIRIASRYCGPPESGNGGYSSGLLARALLESGTEARAIPTGAVEVTLRRPPPLERDLTVQTSSGGVALMAGPELVAEGRSAELDLDLPMMPSFAQASEATARYVGHLRHHFPGCFVCGPRRAEGDGLRIFPGLLEAGVVAAPWVPDASVQGIHGVRFEILWAALDCVGYFSVAAPDYPVALLGRMTAAVTGSVEIGERCVVLGFPIERVGRKLHAGTAVLGEDGRVRGRARQTWIVLS